MADHTIQELREEFSRNCEGHRNADLVWTSSHCYGEAGNFTGFCTILTDGKCPRPTAPDEMDVKILAAARALYDAAEELNESCECMTNYGQCKHGRKYNAASKKHDLAMAEDAARRGKP